MANNVYNFPQAYEADTVRIETSTSGGSMTEYVTRPELDAKLELVFTRADAELKIAMERSDSRFDAAMSRSDAKFERVMDVLNSAIPRLDALSSQIRSESKTTRWTNIALAGSLLAITIGIITYGSDMLDRSYQRHYQQTPQTQQK